MGKASRDKGKRGERELARLLRDRGYDAHRGAQNKGGPDSPDVDGIPGIHIECKRTERLDLYGALDQARRDAGDDVPVVMHRRNDCDWVAILRLDDFLRIWEAGR